jgi:peptidoglycan/xylan/chitin deacetylase (PgdA/CDA1 family)
MNAPSLNVPPEVFAKQMDFIKGHFNIIDPDQLLEGGFEQPAALVTFDDGMLGYFENAVPIMAEREIPSINFLNMDTIEGDVSWAGLVTYLAKYDTTFQAKIAGPLGNAPLDTTTIQPDLVRDCLSSMDSESIDRTVKSFTGVIATHPDLEAVQDSRFVFLGNHLANHYSAPTLARDELVREYRSNQERIDRYPNGRAMFAFPHGCFISDQSELLRSIGARGVFFSSEGINRDVRDSVYNRLSVYSSMTRVEDLLGQIQWMRLKRLLSKKLSGSTA